jgi:hypothetical protein
LPSSPDAGILHENYECQISAIEISVTVISDAFHSCQLGGPSIETDVNSDAGCLCDKCVHCYMAYRFCDLVVAVWPTLVTAIVWQQICA